MRTRLPLSRYQEAVDATPRREGESLEDWVDRVVLAANPLGDRELPPGDRDAREPGEDG